MKKLFCFSFFAIFALFSGCEIPEKEQLKEDLSYELVVSHIGFFEEEGFLATLRNLDTLQNNFERRLNLINSSKFEGIRTSAEEKLWNNGFYNWHRDPNFGKEIIKRAVEILPEEIMKLMDLDENGKIDFLEWTKKYEVQMDALRKSLLVNSSLKEGYLVLKNLLQILPQGLKLKRFIIKNVAKEYNISLENAGYVCCTLLDINNDGILDSKDDVNLDGVISYADFNAIRIMDKYFTQKYGKGYNKNLSIADMLFFIHDKYKININIGYDKENFQPFSDEQKIREESWLISSELKETEKDIGSSINAWIFGLYNRIDQKKKKETVKTWEKTYRIKEFFLARTEKKEPVKIAVYTNTNGYKIFYFDAAKSIDQKFVVETINKYRSNNNELISSTVKGSTVLEEKESFSQNTSGRIVIYDPVTNTKVLLQNDAFVAVFQEEDAKNLDFLLKGKEPVALTSSFREAEKNILSSQLQKIKNINTGFAYFNPIASLQRRNIMLKK